MRMLRLTLTVVVFGAALVVACGAPPDAPTDHESFDARRAALCNDCEPPDPPDPPCTPSCAGKPCGASDGCYDNCHAGACPVGTTCGGGGVADQCGCTPQCAGRACGAPDGCGGVCDDGVCPTGLFCSAGGVTGQCAPIRNGQAVECFVFNDSYANIAGPSDAIFFNGSGQACIPNGAGGTCRRWFGLCRTTDLSHTPVNWRIRGFAFEPVSDAFDSAFSPGPDQACVPGGSNGRCSLSFGGASLADGRPVNCRLFDDDYTKITEPTRTFRNKGGDQVCSNAGCRKWFGRCAVASCGDGTCNDGETPSSCPADCHCGDGVCNGGETCSSCASDCGSCCGDGVCNHGETCGSCANDCGACVQTTCSGQTAGTQAQFFAIGIENVFGCAVAAPVFFANSLGEAAACGKAVFPGQTVLTSGNVASFTYHTDPTFGCASIEFGAFSSERAKTCAKSQGYTNLGPCP
jgi:hypothetical protein